MARDQLDLFGAAVPEIAPASATSAPARPARSSGARCSGRPEVAAEVLTDVHHGKYGLLDDGDRFVVFEDDDRIRLAAEDNVLGSLVSNGYIERRPARDTVSCRHGVIRRPVTPLRLTKQGHALMHRWAALARPPTKQPMAVTSGDIVMTSTCGHSAHAVDEREPYGRWRVSWLPGRSVSRNQATTALVLAGHITAGATSPAHRQWARVQAWAAELDLTAAEAVNAVQLVHEQD
jgi:hypothetical protein